MRTNRMFAQVLISAILNSVALADSDASAAPILVVDDAVEPGAGWVVPGEVRFGDGFGYTSPIEGANLINLAAFDAEPATKSFTGVLLGSGDYSASFWVHNYDNNVNPPL